MKYIYTKVYDSAIKKKELFSPLTTWMEFGGIMLSEMGWTEKDKFCMVSLVCATGVAHGEMCIQGYKLGIR